MITRLSLLGRLCDALRSLPRRCLRTVCDFARHNGGGIAILAALTFPIMLGGMGLGAETSYWYMSQRQLQHTADVAAHAAAVRLRVQDSYSNMKAAATHIAISSGFDAARGTLTLNTPPKSGPSAGDPEKVEVLLTRTYPRWFTAIFNPAPVSLGARAVTGLQGGSVGCILGLNKTAPSTVKIAGSTSVNVVNCDVSSNSRASTSFDKQSANSSITAGCIYTVGKATVHGPNSLSLTGCPRIQEDAIPARDPYATVAEPAVVGPCENGNLTNTQTITPTYNHPSGVKSRRFCSGLSVKSNITFAPGLYIVEGGVFTNSGNTTLIGSGVTFYIRNTSNVQVTGNIAIQLSAPTSGPFSGLLFFGARDATGVSNKVNGSGTTAVQGAVYFPASHLEYSGNSSTIGGCTQVIANTIELTGNSTLRVNCAQAGVRPLWSKENVAILE